MSGQRLIRQIHFLHAKGKDEYRLFGELWTFDLDDRLKFYVDKLDVQHPKLTDQMGFYTRNVAQRLALQCLNLMLNAR